MGRIVVGVDDSSHGRAALAWAYAQAKLRGANLEIVHAWDYPYQGPRTSVTVPKDLMQLDAAEELEAVVRDLVVDESDGVAVHAGLVEGGAAEVLINASNDAELVVVGSRGRGGLASKLLGSTSHAVVQYANCPVVVIRVPDENVH